MMYDEKGELKYEESYEDVLKYKKKVMNVGIGLVIIAICAYPLIFIPEGVIEPRIIGYKISSIFITFFCCFIGYWGLGGIFFKFSRTKLLIYSKGYVHHETPLRYIKNKKELFIPFQEIKYFIRNYQEIRITTKKKILGKRKFDHHINIESKKSMDELYKAWEKYKEENIEKKIKK